MKKIGLPIACMIIAAFFTYASVSATTGSQESTTAGDKKPNINFSGIVITHEGEGFFGNYFNIGGLDRKIIAYHMPPEEYVDEEKKLLLIDPSAGGKEKTTYAEMNLAEIDTIEVPNPHAIWRYLKPDDQKKYNAETQLPAGREFIEIKVTKDDGNIFNYLIELSKKINSDTRRVLTKKEIDRVDAAQPADAKEIVSELQAKVIKKARKSGKKQKSSEQSFFAYPAIKRVMIGNFVRRDDDEERNEKCPPCPPCKPCTREHEDDEEVEEVMDIEETTDLPDTQK
jgi:hypothetical protein